MIAQLLVCVLLAKTELKIVEIPIDTYGLADMHMEHNSVQFEASVVEERMNSVKIIFPEPNITAETYATLDPSQKSLTLNLSVGNQHASIDCDVRAKANPGNAKEEMK